MLPSSRAPSPLQRDLSIELCVSGKLSECKRRRAYKTKQYRYTNDVICLPVIYRLLYTKLLREKKSVLRETHRRTEKPSDDDEFDLILFKHGM